MTWRIWAGTKRGKWLLGAYIYIRMMLGNQNEGDRRRSNVEIDRGADWAKA